jgi:hypothetical protein
VLIDMILFDSKNPSEVSEALTWKFGSISEEQKLRILRRLKTKDIEELLFQHYNDTRFTKK